jgi:hypothetical protein
LVRVKEVDVSIVYDGPGTATGAARDFMRAGDDWRKLPTKTLVLALEYANETEEPQRRLMRRAIRRELNARGG